MGAQDVTPYLCCRDAAAAIVFYTRVFGAVETERVVQPDGRVGHAELTIGGATIMLADEFPEAEFPSPLTLGGSPVIVHLCVADVDGVFARVCAAGAHVLQPVADHADGERRAKVVDPFGHVWVLAEAIPSGLERLWQLADLITPLAIRVAATLRLADHVAAGHGRADDLARVAGCDADALCRLMRYLSVRGLFAETAPDEFALLDPGTPLRDDHPSGTRRWLDLDGFGGTMDRAFFDLLSIVRQGAPGEAGPEEPLSAELGASFDALMETQSRAQAAAIVAGFAWPENGKVVDLGGGTGTLLEALLVSRPGLFGALVEFPETAERARRLLAAAGLAERCEVLAGDLFELPLPRAEIYLLKFVLHGLADAAAIAALARCRDARAPGGRVLVIERSVAAGEDRSQFTAMDLRMLVLGHGRERTLDEYAALAERAGFRSHRENPLPGGLYLIELS